MIQKAERVNKYDPNRIFTFAKASWERWLFWPAGENNVVGVYLSAAGDQDSVSVL